MKKVLILDDEVNIRQSLVFYFEDHEWNTVCAESSEQALEILKTEAVDAVIVDIRLPGMNGNSFITEAMKSYPNLVYVICTGSPEYNIPAELLKHKCVSDDIFRKPVFNMSELEIELMKLIECPKDNK